MTKPFICSRQFQQQYFQMHFSLQEKGSKEAIGYNCVKCRSSVGGASKGRISIVRNKFVYNSGKDNICQRKDKAIGGE